MGTGRPAVRHLDHLVSGGRRLLHRLHGDRRARPGLRAGGLRVFRPALHDPGLPHRFRHHARALARGGESGARHRRRRGARQLRQPVAGTRRGDHGRGGHDALHRLAARGDGRGHQGAGRQRRMAAHRGVPRAGVLHVFLRAARPGADRLRQGHHDLHRGVRGHRHHPEPPGRVWSRVRGGGPGLRRQGGRDRADAPAFADAALRHAGARLGPGRVHVPAHAHGHLCLAERRHHPQKTPFCCRPTPCCWA